MRLYAKVTDIDWDFDDEIDESIPTEYVAEIDIDEDDENYIRGLMAENETTFEEELNAFVENELIDQVSDDWGYCHNGFDFKILKTANNDFDRAKEILENLIGYLDELKDHEGTEEWNDFWYCIAGMNDGEMKYYGLYREEE